MPLVSFPFDSYLNVALIIFLKGTSNVAPLLKMHQWSLWLPAQNPCKERVWSVVWPFFPIWCHLSQLLKGMLISYCFPVHCTHLPAFGPLHHAGLLVEIPLPFLPFCTCFSFRSQLDSFLHNLPCAMKLASSGPLKIGLVPLHCLLVYFLVGSPQGRYKERDSSALHCFPVPVPQQAFNRYLLNKHILPISFLFIYIYVCLKGVILCINFFYFLK